MKKLFLSLMLLATVGSAMAQTPEEKAAQKAAAAAEKAAVKEAQSKLSQAIKLRDEIKLLATANATELAKGDKANTATIEKNTSEMTAKGAQAQKLLREALDSNKLPQKKLFEAYSVMALAANQSLNKELSAAQRNEAFDTVSYRAAYKDIVEAFHGVITTGNKKDELQKMDIAQAEINLPNTHRYYGYDCIFAAQNGELDKAIEAYDGYVNFAKNYPEAADAEIVKNPLYKSTQFAYSIYVVALQQNNYEVADKFYDEAYKWDDPNNHAYVVQSRPQMFLHMGDTAKWEKAMLEIIDNDPTSSDAETAMWNLFATYVKKQDNQLLDQFTTKCLAANPESKSANICRGRFLKNQRKNDEAIKYLEKAGEIDPNEATVFELLGECYYDIGSTNSKKLYGKKYKTQAEADKEFNSLVKSNMLKAVDYYEAAISRSEETSEITKYSKDQIDYIKGLLKNKK